MRPSFLAVLGRGDFLRAVDPLTHVLLGANLGLVVGRRKIGRASALAGALAAFAPDADVFIRSARDPLLAIEYHRGFTHALAFAPVGAAIIAALWLVRPAWRSRSRLAPLWLCAFVAYLSHVLLDAATSYGTQLLWPLSSHRTGWDFISIIDPPFTMVLAVGLVFSLRRPHLKPAVAALLACASYIALGAVQHMRALNAVQQVAAARGHRIERIEVMPTLANNIVWRALYEHDGRIHSDRIRVGWFSAPRVREGWSLPHVRQEDLHPHERTRDTQRSFERFAWFSENWVARSPGDATVLADMRYSLSAEAFDPIWGIRFTTADAPTEVVWVNRSRDRKIEAGEIWREIVGDDSRYHPEIRKPRVSIR